MPITPESQWNTSSGREMPAPDSKVSGPVPIPNKDNGPFQRITANKAKHVSGNDKKGGFGE